MAQGEHEPSKANPFLYIYSGKYVRTVLGNVRASYELEQTEQKAEEWKLGGSDEDFIPIDPKVGDFWETVLVSTAAPEDARCEPSNQKEQIEAITELVVLYTAPQPEEDYKWDVLDETATAAYNAGELTELEIWGDGTIKLPSECDDKEPDVLLKLA